MEIILNHNCYRIGLNHIADTKCCYRGKESKQHGKPFHVHCLFQHIHRTARNCTIFSDDPVFHREYRLGIFGCNTKNSCQPHPEHCARATSSNGCGNSNNIAGSYCCGQCGDQSPEMAYLSFTLTGSGERHLYGPEGILLNKTKPECQKKMCTEKKHQQGNSPDIAADLIQYFFKSSHGTSTRVI